MKVKAFARLHRQPRCSTTQLNLVKLTRSVHWFCDACDRATELNMDGPANVCQFCGSPRVRLVEAGREP